MKISRRQAFFGIAGLAVTSALGAEVYVLDKDMDFEPDAPESRAQAIKNINLGSDVHDFLTFLNSGIPLNRQFVKEMAEDYMPARTAHVTFNQINPHTFEVRGVKIGDEYGVALYEDGDRAGVGMEWHSKLSANDIYRAAEEPRPAKPGLKLAGAKPAGSIP